MSTPTLRDVPCPPCCTGYNGLHVCNSAGYCPCDRTNLHTNDLAPRIRAFLTELTPEEAEEETRSVLRRVRDRLRRSPVRG